MMNELLAQTSYEELMTIITEYVVELCRFRGIMHKPKPRNSEVIEQYPPSRG